MASDGNQGQLELLETSTKSRPRRTYSHKGRTSWAVSLPALKPVSNTSKLAKTGLELQPLRIRNARSLEVKILQESRARQLPSLRAERLDVNGDGKGQKPVEGADGLALKRAGETNSNIAAGPEEITSPVTPASHSQTSPASEESDVSDAEEDEDDDFLILSGQAFANNTKHDRRTGNGMRSLRRRPFLIFDKTESKGYKQLKNEPRPAKTPPVSRYQPGDGFSGREAKPNGSTLLVRTGKLSIARPHVGILDLTQSEPALTKKKRNIRKANLDDNSFMAAPKKKTRRPLQPKDPNQPLKLAAVAPALVKKSNFVLGPAEKALIQLETQRPEANLAREKQGQDAGDTEKRSHQVIPHRLPQDDDDEVDLLAVEESDGIQEHAGATPDRHGITSEEGQDSCETHVTDSPQRQVRITARSVSPESRRSQFDDIRGGPLRWVQAFRRSDTQ